MDGSLFIDDSNCTVPVYCTTRDTTWRTWSWVRHCRNDNGDVDVAKQARPG